MNELSLTNRALRNAKLDTIDSLDDTNSVAAYCRENMQSFIDEMLSEKYWGFARKRISLNRLTITFSDWDYAFDLPDDLIELEALTIKDYNHREYPLEASDYEIFNDETTPDTDAGRVACNHEEIDCVYTKQITVVARLPNYFSIALSYLYAYYLATAFGGAERAGWAYQMYTAVELPKAIGKDNQMKRHNVKGSSELTNTDVIYDPYGYSK